MQIVWQKVGPITKHLGAYIGAVLAALAFLSTLILPGQKALERQSYPMAPSL